MPTLFRASLVVACLLAGGIAQAGQAAPKPPANEDCLACHGDADAKRRAAGDAKKVFAHVSLQ